MNVDPQEILKFDDMAAYWWDPTGPCKPLHDINPLRLQFIQTHTHLHQKNVLDLGCGGGILTESLSTFSGKVTGLDQSAQVLAAAKAHAAHLPTPPTYIERTAEDFAEEHPGTFDVITCMEMLEHVPSPLSILKACHTLLKPGGDLFLSTLNRTPKSFLLAIVGAEYLLKMLPKGTHDYKHFIRPSELSNWAQSKGFRLKSMKGIEYHILTRSFRLSSDVSVNYLMHLQKDS
ncbi:MAG TPA: bifunctional 2-polyprenyl-6-hydroxyphenol methylase/3-demethylubiquinol 3-O-methyltransferase UbiG [Candidatus Berkiella sp.]|nr:bifunctional 2-polyprenyl-6-hydroxyphenol methylase/3-demethylubiquinol 3-O-methyltransferase UbiG [Candidatus Berkiella sp.]